MGGDNMAGSKEWSNLEIATGVGPWRGLPHKDLAFPKPEREPQRGLTSEENSEASVGLPIWMGLPRKGTFGNR
jgi:hypothetical protein